MTFQKGHPHYPPLSKRKDVPMPVTDAAPSPRAQKDVRRFTCADLSDMGLWLVGRLGKTYKLADRQIVTLLHACMEGNEYHFVRTADAVGLARRVQPLFSPAYAEVAFVWTRIDVNDECQDVCHALARWAKGLGLSEMLVGDDLDMSDDDLRKVFSKLFKVNLSRVKV